MESEVGSIHCIVCGKSDHKVFLHSLQDRLNQAQFRYDYIECNGCGLISLHPFPDLETIRSFYPKSFWRTNSRKTSSQSLVGKFETWYRKRLMLKEFKRILPYIKPGMTHLDVGCATGDFIVICKNKGLISSGIELSLEAVQYCRKRRGLDVIEGDLIECDFEGRKFDLITYNGVFEHVSNPYAHLMKCRSLLNPDGLLCITGLPNIESLGFHVTRDKWLGLDYPRHLYQFTRKSLSNLLYKSGYSLVEINFHSPRFNPPSLAASIFPGLHRHKFAEYEIAKGKNPVFRKIVLMILLKLLAPIDWILSSLGYGENLACVAVLK